MSTTRKPELRVLAPLVDSFAGGCPVLPLMFRDLRKDGAVDVHGYSPGAFLRERWDIIYVYWPEWLLRRDRGTGFTLLDSLRVIAELRVARMRGAKVVWYTSNIVAHETDRWGVVDGFFRTFAALTDQLIAGTQTVLDEFAHRYPVLRGADQRVVQLGNLRGFYPDRGVSQAEARRHLGLPADRRIGLSLGMVRRYKNHLGLVRSFRTVAAKNQDAFLLIAGKPFSDDTADRLRSACRDLSNVRLDLRYIPDDELQYYLRVCDFLILPASLATTSSSAMLALSYDLPVLLPHRSEYLEWRELLGPQWVKTYEGGFRPGVLAEAFEASRPEGAAPLEEHFDWAETGRGLLAAFQDIVTPIGNGRGQRR